MKKICNHCGREMWDGFLFPAKDICPECRAYFEERDREVFRKKIKREFDDTKDQIKSGMKFGKWYGKWIVTPLLFMIFFFYILGGLLTMCSK